MKTTILSLIGKSMSCIEESARLRYLTLFVILFGIRSFYISLSGNYAGDTDFYLNIANNIATGHGFSFSSGDGESSVAPVVGGYFPAYPSLLALFQFLDLGVAQIALFVGCLYVTAIIYLGNTIQLITKNLNLSNAIIIVLGISPTGLGFSRFLLIEPVLGVFGILICALCLKFHFRLGNRLLAIGLLCFLFVSALYFKPTAIVFFSPICLTLIVSLGLRVGLKMSLFFAVISLLLIMPWGIRNLLLGADKLFPTYANIWPANISGISSWVKSWAITEYDRASILFPIWSGNIQQVAINQNLFLDERSASLALDLIRMNSHSLLSPDTDEAFSKLSASLNSPTPINCLRISLLKILQSISLALHPANSWGFPVEVSLKGFMVTPSTAQLDVFMQNIPKILVKVFLFAWRLFFYSVLLASMVRLLRVGRFFSRLSQLALNPKEIGIEPLMILLSLSILLSTLILYVGIFTGLEHRYLYPVMPWIEATCIFPIARLTVIPKYSS